LFQAMFNLVPAPVRAEAPDAADAGAVEERLDVRPVPGDAGTARFDLSLALRETDSGLEGYLEYSTDLFAGPTARELSSDYVRLLERIVQHPDADLARLAAGAGQGSAHGRP
jgi:hypothetical protein